MKKLEKKGYLLPSGYMGKNPDGSYQLYSTEDEYNEAFEEFVKAEKEES